MPFCPQCRSEYRAGFDRCADCQVPLVAELPAPPAPGEWVEIFRGSATAADLVCAALDEAGIATSTPDDYVTSLGWYGPGSFNNIRILVRSSDAERAMDILEQSH